MAKNLSRKFATMSEEERRRFALEEEEGTSEHPAELAFDEPRDEDNMGPQYSSIKQEIADPEHRAARRRAASAGRTGGVRQPEATRGRGRVGREHPLISRAGWVASACPPFCG
jgi:hypothetical protein